MDSEKTMKRIAVTGAGGYIGSRLVQQLIEAGHSVLAIDRFFFGQSALTAPTNGHAGQLEILRRDIRDLTADDLSGCEVVVDLAALSNDPSGDLDPDLTLKINHIGRVHVARMARDAGVARYVMASSCSVYGHGGDEFCDEDSPTDPLTVYAKSMLLAEHDILPMASHDFCVTALRNATVFGLSPRMRFDLVVNIMTRHAVETGRLTVLGGGRQWRPLVHVADVGRSIQAVFDAPRQAVNGEVFNVGHENARVLSIAYMVREALPFPIQIDVAPEDADARDYRVSFDKIKDRLCFSANVTVGSGVMEIYDAMKSGKVDTGPKTVTVGWYKQILEAKNLIDTITLGDRLI
jgi:nucleoside-diphosphate-sugar epimerase